VGGSDLPSYDPAPLMECPRRGWLTAGTLHGKDYRLAYLRGHPKGAKAACIALASGKRLVGSRASDR
jgi:hypothetical protein